MLVLDETEAKRGAKEIRSCILAFLNATDASKVTKVKTCSKYIMEMGKKFVEVDVLLNSMKFINSKTTDKFNFLLLKSFTVRRNSLIPTLLQTVGHNTSLKAYPLTSNHSAVLVSSCVTNLRPAYMINTNCGYQCFQRFFHSCH